MTVYQNCSNRSAPLNKLNIEKPLNDFFSLTPASILKIIIQERSLDDCLPKLLKSFRSVEQNGH